MLDYKLPLVFVSKYNSNFSPLFSKDLLRHLFQIHHLSSSLECVTTIRTSTQDQPHA